LEPLHEILDLQPQQTFGFRGAAFITAILSLACDRSRLIYTFTYRHAERTPTDAEVNATHEKVVAQLKQGLQAIVRE